ncbi:hypothetical protein QT970_11980, partial [Microcoleus sp. herbarium8]
MQDRPSIKNLKSPTELSKSLKSSRSRRVQDRPSIKNLKSQIDRPIASKIKKRWLRRSLKLMRVFVLL